MPTELTTDVLRATLAKKIPPRDENDPMTIFTSTVLVLSERLDMLDAEITKTRGMVKFLTQKLIEADIIEIHKEGAPSQQQKAPASSPQAAGTPAATADEEQGEEDEDVEFIPTQQQVKVQGMAGASTPPPATVVSPASPSAPAPQPNGSKS